jgi:hypothetical protein
MTQSLAALRARAHAPHQNLPPFLIPAAISAPGVVAFAGPEGPGLGKNRKTPTAPRQRHRSFIRVSTAQRLVSEYWSAKQENLPGSSVVGCGRWRSFGSASHKAQIAVTADGPSLQGHFVCGCNWTCDRCAGVTIAQNRSWLRGAFMPAVAKRGLSFSMVTLTLAHRYEDDWALAVKRLKAAWGLTDKRLCKAYKRAGSIGKFKALEAVVGQHGLHPHFHILITHAADADLSALKDEIRWAWGEALDEVGGHCNDHGFHFEENAAASYAAKMETTHELVSQNTKRGRLKGRSLPQLLDAAGRGDELAGVQWQRAVKAMNGANRFHSGALAKKLDIPCPSKWEDPEGPKRSTELVELIEYNIDDHLMATSAATGRPGLAMILRAARSGKESVLAMVQALCGEVRKKRDRPSLLDYRPEPNHRKKALASCNHAAGPEYNEA